MTRATAQTLYQTYKDTDPLPVVAVGLLNRDEIVLYVNAIGLIDPFTNAHEKLKAASYEIDFSGDVYFWDGGSVEPISVKVGPGHPPFTLKRNSICFFSPDTLIQLPSYIAMRFH